MWFREVEVPDELVEAATEGNLVLFVGAGASLDEPSGLPDFSNLVRDVGTRANRVPTDRHLDRPDVFLGDLADLQIEVHALVASAINKPGSQSNRLHQAIIDLAWVHPNPRVVTTNYDLHLERASRSKGLDVDVYRAPALPVGDDFTGIVHLHGALDQPSRKLVVTDEDFGHAYLREAYAARFLDRMFSAFSVAFIGYSHGDIVMQYLARSLSREGRRFVFTHEADSREWRRLGLLPVRYPVDGPSHLALVDGLERWAELTAWGRLAHRRRIAELVSNGPPTIPEEVSYLEDALGHPERVLYFTERARGSDWLLWAANRPEFNRLFHPAACSDDDRTVSQALTRWVVDHYAMDERESPTALRLLRNCPWSPSMWDTLAHRLFAQEQRVPDWQVPWLILVLHRSPAEHSSLLDMLLCKASWQERPELALMLLEHRTRPFPRPGVDVGPSDDAPRFEVVFAGDDHWLDEAWKKVFIPLLPQHAPELLDLAVRQLRDAHRLGGALQPGFDGLTFGRSAIEPHSQDDFRDAADVLIDIARDSLEHLLHTSPRETAAMVERLARAKEPLLRRLAVHAWRLRGDRTPDDKLRWILEEDSLYDLDLQHEVYMLLEDSLASASDNVVTAVLDHAKAGPQDSAEHSPYVPYNLLAWLNRVLPESGAIAEEFTKLQEENPEFAPREHPDLNVTMTSGFVENAEPFTRDELHELIASSPAEAYAAIRSYTTADAFRFTGPTWTGTLNALRGCVTHYPGDGIRLADLLAPDDNDVRDTLVRAWSSASLSSTPEQADGVEAGETKRLQSHGVTPLDVLKVIGSWPMHTARSAVANMFARGGTADQPTAWHTLIPARRLASHLWPTTEVSGNVVDSEDHYLEAINHPAGNLAQFWLNVVAYDWRDNTDTWLGIPDDLQAELDRMVHDQSRNGLLARVLLTTRLRFFNGADPAWATSRLFPLFTWDRDTTDPSEVRGIWRSFVQFGQYDDQILADGLLDSMLATMRRANDLDNDEAIAQLGRQLATIALKSSLDPTGWVSTLTTDAPNVLKLAWIRSVGQQLRKMDPKDASAQWTRWIREYWTRRIDSLPRPLNKAEASAMALWVLGLPHERLEAVELLERTDAGLVKDDRVLMHLTGSRHEHQDLTCDPTTWARYVVHLLRGTTDPPWALDHYLREIVGGLRPAVPSPLFAELIDEAMRLGCTDAEEW
ncbi:SIR2 family protein [Ornithinimicrobium sp. LYQ92]|uniref:SIR2 family protein n=1 Tax=Serinicoccus sp. LYQ92 TaxID=3378798 RepID=UPI003851F98D